MAFTEEELRLTIRQVEEIISEADRLLGQPFNSAETESLAKFAFELKQFIEQRSSNQLIIERLLKIPLMNAGRIQKAEYGWSIRSFAARRNVTGSILEMKDIFSSIAFLLQTEMNSI